MKFLFLYETIATELDKMMYYRIYRTEINCYYAESISAEEGRDFTFKNVDGRWIANSDHNQRKAEEIGEEIESLGVG